MAFLKRVLTGGKEREGAFLRIPEAIPSGKKVLYIPNFGRLHRPEMIDEFAKNGYSISRVFTYPGDPFPGREKDLGFGVDEELKHNSSADEIVAARTHVDQPKKFDTSALFESAGPFVVKFPMSDRGESVFLLEGKENIAKFIAYNIEHFNNNIDHNTREVAAMTAKKEIAGGNWNWEGFKKIEISDAWSIQEYIETPSDYYTSFRILVDGYGNIHYGTLLRSPEKKGIRRVKERDQNPFDHSFTYLHNPENIFCLDAPDIVSNVVRGGIDIQLNGTSVNDEVNRSVLYIHGIDPDNPQIPDVMQQKAARIGIAMKGVFPFVGIDFIYDRQLNDFFLEANPGPALLAEGLGVSQDEIRIKKGKEHEQEYLARVLIRRIAKNAPK